jgi:hypothetical protein
MAWDFLWILNYFSKGKGVNLVYGSLNRVHGIRSMGLWSSLNASHWNRVRRLRLDQAQQYGGFYSGVLIGEHMTKGDSRPGMVLRMAVWPAHSGGSPELAVYGALSLGFLWDFHLRHWGNVANPFCSPWDDGRWWCQLATVGQFSPSLASMFLRQRWMHQRGQRSSMRLLGQSTWLREAGSSVAMAKGGAKGLSSKWWKIQPDRFLL